MANSTTVHRGHWRWLSVGVIAALTVSACGSGGSDGTSGAKSITFWYSTSAQDQGYVELAKEFQAKEGISVEIVNVPYDGYQDKLRQAAQGTPVEEASGRAG